MGPDIVALDELLATAHKGLDVSVADDFEADRARPYVAGVVFNWSPPREDDRRWVLPSSA